MTTGQGARDREVQHGEDFFRSEQNDVCSTFGLLPHDAIHSANDLESYSRRIPWAGSVILRISHRLRLTRISQEH